MRDAGVSRKKTEPKTDYELAMAHKYVTVHGREPAPGVTSCSVWDIPALKWSSAEIAAKFALEFAERSGNEQQDIINAHRATMSARRYPTVKNYDGVKVHASKASDDEILVHYLRGEFQRQWDVKADLGTRVHDIGEKLSTGRDADVLPSDSGYVDAWFRFFEECRPTFIEVERVVLSPCPMARDDLEYGGRTDNFLTLGAIPERFLEVVTFRADEILCGDYKTGGHYVGPCATQASGYTNAAGMATYLPNGDLGQLEPLPDCKGAVTINLHGDGTYHLFDAFKDISRADAWRLFMLGRESLNHLRAIEKLTSEKE